MAGAGRKGATPLSLPPKAFVAPCFGGKDFTGACYE